MTNSIYTTIVKNIHDIYNGLMTANCQSQPHDRSADTSAGP